MFGPVASKLVMLRDLKDCAPGTKVRFLGCIDEYVVRTATLRLKHDYPLGSVPAFANVNIEHLLESVKRHEVEVGSWLNVIGYVDREKVNEKEKGVHVQAIALWDAGNVDVGAYEQAVESRKEAG